MTRLKVAWWRLAAAVVVLTSAAGPARAEEASYRLKVVIPKPKATTPAPDGEGTPPPADPNLIDPANGMPFVRAVIGGRVGLTAKDFLLKQTDAQPPLVIEAMKSVPYQQSDEPMALIVLVQGNFRWMGNETYTDAADPEAGSIYDGAFKGLGPAIDVLGKAGPPGSKASLLVYAEQKVIVKQAMGDAPSLNAGALGGQQDYGEFISKPLALGLTEAWKVLANMPDFRKVLVVFGDGQDDKEDVSADLKKAISDLKEAGVEVYSVFYTNTPEDGPQGQQNMAKVGFTSHLNAQSRDSFASQAGLVVEEINAKYYVDFPGDKVQFDGATHEFVLAVGGEDKEPAQLSLPTVVKPVEEEGSLWWVWLLVIVLLVALVVVIILIRRRQPVEEMPLAPPPVLGPMKTIMLGVGGNEDSLPVVGWVVPLAGPNQFQTFKLMQGATKLGTGGESHVVVGDSFMSTEHAEIVCTAGGFTINDLGSTNGTYVNARRVSSQELVDNDVFKLGKTDFKFKSIN
ncbi:MAG TPA: FHA domain-containing protein [Kofleriaceae bacterium]|nr:FHA domain-containing protein [Kofleriaceae bacterium]